MSELEKYKDLLLEKKSFVQVGLVKKDGTPHVSPLWFDTNPDDINKQILYINTAKGRVKGNNLHKGTPVALVIMDPDNPYRYLGIEGEVMDEIIGEEAEKHIDNLAFKYLGEKSYPYRKEGEVRIKLPIKIMKVHKR